MKNPPVIIVGAQTIGLAALRAFSHLDIQRILVSYDKDDSARVSRYVTKLYELPLPEKNNEEFLTFLINLGKQYQGAMLLPASDTSLSAISKKKEELSIYYKVACPEWKIIEKIIDKKQTYSLAEKLGLPAPRMIIPKSEMDIVDYSNNFEFPCLIKPTKSHEYFAYFFRKMVFVKNVDEALTAYREAVKMNFEVIMQEYIPGEDSDGINYNSYFFDGQPLVEFTAKKIRNAPPRLGSPCALISKKISDVYESGRNILKALNFYGYSCTEFKRDSRDGIYKLMEVNGRHNLSGLLATSCGINFPVLHYRHLVFDELPVQSDYQEGVYWLDVSRDFAYHFPDVLRYRYPLKEFIKPYFAKHVFAVLDFQDFKPTIKRYSHLAGVVLSGKRTV